MGIQPLKSPGTDAETGQMTTSQSRPSPATPLNPKLLDERVRKGGDDLDLWYPWPRSIAISGRLPIIAGGGMRS